MEKILKSAAGFHDCRPLMVKDREILLARNAPIWQEVLLKAKRPGKTTILYLSDLHFKSHTELKEPHIKGLTADILQFKKDIDLVICTGDLTDNPLTESVNKTNHRSAMEKVREFLESVCKICGIDPGNGLFVVPGNHDYRVQGLVSKKASQILFQEYFGKYFRNVIIPEFNLLIYSFDSNGTDTRLNFATGLARQEDLIDFQRQMTEWKEKYPEFDSLTKIALLHHHPMPISETEKRAVTEGEEFQLLKNAGTFMKEMIKAKVDLILHGHKHFIGYSRARFPLVDGIHEIGVVAAGSAGQPYNGIYSYNLLTIPMDGPIEVEQRVLNTGSYEKSFPFTIPESYSEWRQIRFRKFLDRPSVTAMGKADFTEVAVKESGDSERYSIIKGMEAKKEDVESLKWFSASVVAKFEEPVCSCLNRPEQSIDVKSKSSVPGQLDYEMFFSPPLRKDRPLDVEIRRSANNAFFFNVQDRLDVTGSTSKTEYVSWSRQGVYELLDMKIRFLHDRRVLGPRVEVLDNGGNINNLETDYCLSRFVYSEEKRVAHFAVDFPVPGNNYKIIWNLPGESEKFGVRERKMAEAIEDKLVKCLEDNSLNMRVKSLLEELKLELHSHFSLLGNDDDFEIALMTFHRNQRLLVTVTGLYPSGHPIFSWQLKKGQGIEGQALRRRSSLFAFESGTGSEWRKYHVDPPHIGGKADGYSLVFVIPFTYPFNSDRVVALFRLASTSKTSHLLSLENDDKLQREFTEIVIMRGYLKRFLPELGMMGPYAALDKVSNRIIYTIVDESGKLVELEKR